MSMCKTGFTNKIDRPKLRKRTFSLNNTNGTDVIVLKHDKMNTYGKSLAHYKFKR